VMGDPFDTYGGEMDRFLSQIGKSRSTPRRTPPGD